MGERLIHLPKIGKVLFRKNYYAKYLNLHVDLISGIKVTVPYFVSYADARTLVLKHNDWIMQRLTKLKETEKPITKFDENSKYSTRKHTLSISRSHGNSISVNVADGIINVLFPHNVDTASDEAQTAIRNGIEIALRKEAVEYIPKRVEKFAEKYGFKYKRLYIKKIRSRWGSCSKDKNINLSIYLMKLPNHLIDYVILHELAHLKQYNHGKNFWKLLDDLTGRARSLDKELKNYIPSIY